MLTVAGMVLLAPSVTEAVTINFGIDISNAGAITQLVGGTTGDDTGFGIVNGNTPWTFFINTPGLVGATINSMTLFLDAENVNCSGACGLGEDKFWLNWSSAAASGTWTKKGDLQNTDAGNTFAFNPVLAAVQTRIVSNLGVYFQIDSNNLLGSTDFRFDAANLAVNYTAAAVPPVAAPEPASLMLLGSGLIAIAARARRRRKL